MQGRVRRVASHERRVLHADWAICATPAAQVVGPAELADVPLAWLEGRKVGTAACMLRQAGQWTLDGAPRRFDAEDWWFRCDFNAPDDGNDGPLILGFDGLATLAEAWLNGEPILQSANMFVAHEVDVTTRIRLNNSLLICCRSLNLALSKRRPRPRWRAPMIEHQQMRWQRNTVLGRTPGWSPPAAAVGPWRDVWLERRDLVSIESLCLRSELLAGDGRLTVACDLKAIGSSIESVAMALRRNGEVHISSLLGDEAQTHFSGVLPIENVDAWWPHTLGEPAVYEAVLEVVLVGGRKVDVELGPVGFRKIALTTESGGFSIAVNGVPIFCRGACWTPLDIVSLRSSPEGCAKAIEAVSQAGMNMLRVAGTMVYEDESFLDACDRAGVLVWQDLMFANMDFPQADEAFKASVELELRQQLQRLQAHPCLALICGNSEVEQQAAMWGTAREAWQPGLFHADIPAWVDRHCPGVAYWPSSAHGGSIPHQVDVGSTSYFGVGAYLRPLDDARRSNLRFASECLAFANVPEDSALARMPGGSSARVHHPGWKSRTPRDLGAGWDFDDVRDFYFGRFFGVDPLTVRYANHERYLKLSRILTGEIMAAALSEWRREGSSCNGALILFLRDLWAGAGWGLLDDQGVPKACWHYVKRACQPIAVAISDEGCNGLYVHAWNDPGRLLAAQLEIALYRQDGVRVGHAARALSMAPHAALTIVAGAEFETAIDISAAFRFSDSEYALVVASLRSESGELLSQAFHEPGGRGNVQEADIGLTAQARRRADGKVELCLVSRLWAQAVHFDIGDYRADDEYFHLAPQCERRIVLEPIAGQAAAHPAGSAMAMNSRRVVNIEWLS